MKKEKLKTLLLSAFGAVGFTSIAIGTTYALFTSQAETSIEVNSGKINVQEQVSVTSLKSALYDPDGTYDVDKDGNHYTSQEGWANGGNAEVLSDGTLSLTKMTPGDKVDFKVQMKNNSNITCKYRFVFEAVDKSSLLASGLRITLNDDTYDGLLSYATDWVTIAPEADPQYADLIVGSIYLPLIRDDAFQNLNTSYNLSLEAIQSNAYTTGGSSYEVASYLPQVATLDEDKKASVIYDKDQPTQVKVDLDLSNSQSYAAGQEIVLGVNNVDVIENASSFVVSEGNTAAAAIDLSLYINDQKVTNGFAAKIATKVATGLDEQSIKIEYDSDTPVAFSNGGTKVPSVEEVDAVGEFYYNSTTGDLVFMTDHFSDYIVTANNINAYNKTTKMSYVSFDDAVKGAKTGDVITLIKDVNLTSFTPTSSSRYMISDVNLDELTIDGLGHKVTIGGRGFGIQIEKTTFRNVDIINNTSAGRCIDTRPDGTHPVNELNLENVNLQTDGGVYDQPLTIGGNSSTALKLNINNSTIKAPTYYAIIAFNPIDCKINNSTIEGWACLYLKGINSSAGSAGSKIEINNSIFNSANKYSGETNDFAAIMCEDLNGEVEIDIYQSTLNVTTTGDAFQAFIASDNNTAGVYDLSIQKSRIYLTGEHASVSFVDSEDIVIDDTQIFIDNELQTN